MKKTIFVLFVLFVCTACTKNENISCVYENANENNKYTTTVDISIKDSEVENATATIVYEDSAAAESICEIYKSADDGENVECNDTKIILNNFHKSISKEPLSKSSILEYFRDRDYTCTGE